MLFDDYKKKGHSVVSFFVKGIFFLLPLFVTFYFLNYCINLVLSLTGLDISRFYILFIIFVFITICGYWTDNFVLNKFYTISEWFIDKIPIISVFYFALKTIFNKIVNNQIKFDKPVLVYINVLYKKKNDIKKLGFITNQSLEFLSLKDDVAVLIPQAFSLSADVWIVPKKNIVYIETDFKGIDLYNFVITGGIVDIKNKNIVKRL